jgi:hypothetical protein
MTGEGSTWRKRCERIAGRADDGGSGAWRLPLLGHPKVTDKRQANKSRAHAAQAASRSSVFAFTLSTMLISESSTKLEYFNPTSTLAIILGIGARGNEERASEPRRAREGKSGQHRIGQFAYLQVSITDRGIVRLSKLIVRSYSVRLSPSYKIVHKQSHWKSEKESPLLQNPCPLCMK